MYYYETKWYNHSFIVFVGRFLLSPQKDCFNASKNAWQEKQSLNSIMNSSRSPWQFQHFMQSYKQCGHCSITSYDIHVSAQTRHLINKTLLVVPPHCWQFSTASSDTACQFESQSAQILNFPWLSIDISKFRTQSN